MNTTKAEQFFANVTKEDVNRYCAYWNSIKPTTIEDVFRRWLFAFTSVHTTWESNVRGYNAIKDMGWIGNKADLLQRLTDARCGMQNNRTNYIYAFTEKFFGNTDLYGKAQEKWQEYRNELVNGINGLGMAKVSFALEMCHPLEAMITCIDTHIIQLYDLENIGFTSKKDKILYQEAENHWLACSKAVDAPPTISRAIYWDKKQEKLDSRYWTYVLEA